MIGLIRGIGHMTGYKATPASTDGPPSTQAPVIGNRAPAIERLEFGRSCDAWSPSSWLSKVAGGIYRTMRHPFQESILIDSLTGSQRAFVATKQDQVLSSLWNATDPQQRLAALTQVDKFHFMFLDYDMEHALKMGGVGNRLAGLLRWNIVETLRLNAEEQTLVGARRAIKKNHLILHPDKRPVAFPAELTDWDEFSISKIMATLQLIKNLLEHPQIGPTIFEAKAAVDVPQLAPRVQDEQSFFLT